MDEHGSGGLFDVRRETPSRWILLTRAGYEIPEKPKVRLMDFIYNN